MSLKNDLGEIKRISSALTEFLGEEGVPPRGVNRARLVTEELLVNIIQHAFEDEAKHTIVLTLRTEPRCVQVVTEDDGKPFDPRQTPPPPLGRPLEEQAGSGYGVFLIKSMTRSLDYTHTGGRNRLSAVVEYGSQEVS